ncbi:MAG: hypothetical protein E6K64_07930, partial [Nitrospirae bacterium]
MKITAGRTVFVLSMCLMWLWPGDALSQPTESQTGGVTGKEKPPAGQPAGASPDTRANGAEKSPLIVTRDYIIGPEDVLEITVWKNQDLSKVVAVRPDGRISLPLIGEAAAVGRTPAQLTEEISAKLKEFKENPQVSIVVKEVNSYSIFVLGEVSKPGR